MRAVTLISVILICDSFGVVVDMSVTASIVLAFFIFGAAILDYIEVDKK